MEFQSSLALSLYVFLIAALLTNELQSSTPMLSIGLGFYITIPHFPEQSTILYGGAFLTAACD